MIDGECVADVDNPKGYYGWEPIKQIGKKPELLDEEGLDGLRCIGKNLACSLKGTALAIPATKSDWRFRPAAEITHAKRLHHHRKRLAALGHFAHDADAGCWRSPAVNGQPARRG